MVADASAQLVCLRTQEMRELLRSPYEYGETLIATALKSNGLVLEIWVNLQTQRFTIVETQARGVTCIVAVGSAFEPAPVGSKKKIGG